MKKIILISIIALVAIGVTSCSNPKEKVAVIKKQEAKAKVEIRLFTSSYHGWYYPDDVEKMSEKYIFTVVDRVLGKDTNRTLTYDDIYGPTYEEQVKKIFFDSNNDGKIDSVEIHRYSWVFPENYTPTSQPYRTCTKVEVLKQSKKNQDEYENLLTVKKLLDTQITEYQLGEHRDESDDHFTECISASQFDSVFGPGYHLKAYDYMWVVNYL